MALFHSPLVHPAERFIQCLNLQVQRFAAFFKNAGLSTPNLSVYSAYLGTSDKTEFERFVEREEEWIGTHAKKLNRLSETSSVGKNKEQEFPFPAGRTCLCPACDRRYQ